MNGVFKKTLFGILSVCLLSSFSLALENEYKNALTKVELTKTGENSYSVNLYTQKKYSEPVKVIKKSDLNYYILLPETKNSAVQITSNNKDIRNVSTNLYPYAGVESTNNGYTKININTVKPINFSINTKTNQTAKAISTKQTIASNTVKENTEVQKKNLVSSNSPKAQLAPKVQETKKQIQKNSITKKTLQNKQESVQKQTPAVSKKNTKIQSSNKIISKQAIVKPKKKEQVLNKEQVEQVQKPKIEEIIQQDIEEEKTKVQDVEPVVEEQTEENLALQDEPVENVIDESSQSLKSKIKSVLLAYKIKVQNKLNQYGIGLKDLLLMAVAGVISFFAMLFILNRKQNNPKLKSRIDLINSDSCKNVNKPKPKKENNGQYFVFDNNIKQTGFYNPAMGKRKNFELSSYNPDLSQDIKKPSIEKYQQKQNIPQDDSKNEYEIIQKILKEDSIIEFTPDEFRGSKVYTSAPEKTVKKPVEKSSETTKNVKNPIQKTVPIKKEIAEPVVLSSVEIAPERGFMCVSYDDNINLVGYIFDDVFALHNFKQPKLANYDIKFRLTERDDKGANFIVKVENTKMLIKVTKTSMNLEVVM